MDWQFMFNMSAGVIAVLGGWMFKILSDNLKSLKDSNKEMFEKIQKIEVLVAGEYAKKSDVEKSFALYKEGLDTLSTAFMSRMDRFESKIDLKADK